MIIGSTPTHTFTLPFDTSLINDLVITYKQNDEIVLQKQMSDCIISENKLTTNLTQDETLKFEEGIYSVQVKIKTKGDKVTQSVVTYSRVCKSLYKEKI